MDQPAFVPVQFAQPHQNTTYHGNEVPARVQVACDVLRELTFKTMARGMVNEIGFDTLPGQELTLRETEMQSAACNMLVAYFKGELAPSPWEAFMVNSFLVTPPNPPPVAKRRGTS